MKAKTSMSHRKRGKSSRNRARLKARHQRRRLRKTRGERSTYR